MVCDAGRTDGHGERHMSVFKNGKFYHYEFKLDGRRHRGSTGTANKPQAIAEERRQRERLEKSYGQIIEEEAREQRRKTIQQAADEFLDDYKAEARVRDVRRLCPRTRDRPPRRQARRGDHADGREAVSDRSAGGEGRPEDHQRRGACCCCGCAATRAI